MKEIVNARIQYEPVPELKSSFVKLEEAPGNFAEEVINRTVNSDESEEESE